MTQKERSQVAELWLTVAAMYGRDISRGAMTLMLDSIADLDSHKVLGVLSNWVRSARNKTHPLPGDIRELVNPQLSAEAKANEAATRIRAAIVKFGWAQGAEAKEWIGELGWGVVKRTGGWSYLCENHGLTLDPLTFHAQAREIAKSMIEQKKLGVFDQPVNLEGPKTQQLERTEALLSQVLESKKI